MQHDPTTHRPWCDGLHVSLGLPECSCETADIEGVKVLLYGTEIHTDVAIVKGDARLLVWPAYLMVKLVRALDNAVRIARGQVAP